MQIRFARKVQFGSGHQWHDPITLDVAGAQEGLDWLARQFKPNKAAWEAQGQWFQVVNLDVQHNATVTGATSGDNPPVPAPPAPRPASVITDQQFRDIATQAFAVMAGSAQNPDLQAGAGRLQEILEAARDNNHATPKIRNAARRAYTDFLKATTLRHAQLLVMTQWLVDAGCMTAAERTAYFAAHPVEQP